MGGRGKKPTRISDTSRSPLAQFALAVSFPNLRRLTLSAACFSAEGVLALCRLAKLESLSLDGSLECPGGAEQAADVYRQLMQQLPGLRQLRLPQAVPACGAALEESDDEEAEHEQLQQEQGAEEEEEDEVIAASRRHAVQRGASSPFISDLTFPLLLSPLRPSPLRQPLSPLSPRPQPPASPAQLPELPFPVSPIPQPAALVPPPLPRRAPAQSLDEFLGFHGSARAGAVGPFATTLSGAAPALPGLLPLPPLPRLATEPPMSAADTLAAPASFGSFNSRSSAGRILFFNDVPGSSNNNQDAEQVPPQPQPQAPSRSSGTGLHPVPNYPAVAGYGPGTISLVAPSAPVPGPRLLRSPRKPAASLAEGFVFPQHLEDLTIPLCALNRPVFEAVCSEYGQSSASAPVGSSARCSGSTGVAPVAALALPQPSIGRRVLSFPYLPALGGGAAARTVATAGALAAWGAGADGGISRPGFAVMSSSSTNSSSRSSSFNNSSFSGEQDAHATATSPAAGVIAMRSRKAAFRHAEADSGLRRTCGSSGTSSDIQQARPARRSLRSLHIPTLAGYSHWEGSFLRSARDFERLGTLGAELEVLHLSLELGSFRLTPNNMRACLQHLSSLCGLRVSNSMRIASLLLPAACLDL